MHWKTWSFWQVFVNFFKIFLTSQKHFCKISRTVFSKNFQTHSTLHKNDLKPPKIQKSPFRIFDHEYTITRQTSLRSVCLATARAFAKEHKRYKHCAYKQFNNQLQKLIVCVDNAQAITFTANALPSWPKMLTQFFCDVFLKFCEDFQYCHIKNEEFGSNGYFIIQGFKKICFWQFNLKNLSIITLT